MYQLYACLIDEPYLLKFHEIAELTDRQIYDLYYRARDKDGSPEIIDDPEAEWQVKPVEEEVIISQQDAYNKYMAMAQAVGITAKVAQGKWDEAQQKKRASQ